MKIIQMLTTISCGDAVSNDTLALHAVIAGLGYGTGIYAENIGPGLPAGIVRHVRSLPRLNDQDVIIYHLSTGTVLNYTLESYKGRKIIVYHNITPPEFFEEYSSHAAGLGQDGLRGMAYLAGRADYCLADSGFNRKQLLAAGYACRIDVLPVLIPFRDYEKKPDGKILGRYADDGYTNILFTGRIAPNKKQEDIIRMFYQYQKRYCPKSRLFLAGSYDGMEAYYERLREYVRRLRLEHVYFTGHVRFEELLAYYHLADAFVCMSEHEGFCVPLVEAMYFKIPVLAYNSTAVPETLGGSGFLTDTKDPVFNASVLNYILTDVSVRQTLLEGEKERLADLAGSRTKRQFIKYLKAFLGEKDEK